MSYWHARSTAEAKAYLEQRAAEDAIARRPTAAGQRMLMCGVTCQQWLDVYLRRIPPPHNTESDHEQNGRQIEGPQARSVSAGEGMGDPPSQEAVSEARQGGDDRRDCIEEVAIVPEPQRAADWIEEAIGSSAEAGQGWADEAYPASDSAPHAEAADFTTADRTPF